MSTERTSRLEPLDAARGALLASMVAVHVISAHGTAGQATWLHEWFGIFLISAGFVALSGYVQAVKAGAPQRGDWLRAADIALHLLLVMVAYGVLLSLLRHGLGALARGPGACASGAWLPPVRFEDLGILLPIALVQLLSPFGRSRRPAALAVAVALAVGFMILPALAHRLPTGGPAGWLVDVLARRKLTPFYTVSYFVAIGLAAVLLGRLPWPAILQGRATPISCLVALELSVLLASPVVSQAVLDPGYRLLGGPVGSLLMLAYWAVTIGALLRGFAVPLGGSPSRWRRLLALLGRHSLAVFVAHDLLLQLNGFGRDLLRGDKGLLAIIVMIVVDVALLGLLAWALECSRSARGVASALLLSRSGGPLLRRGALGLAGALALCGILAVYTSGALARPTVTALIDDFERTDGCPHWWSFGALRYERAPVEAGAAGRSRAHLAVRGPAPGMFAHGTGLFLRDDLGPHRTLKLDVRGHGPGSGRLKIELAEDDNGNWEIEKDPRLFTPVHDDRLVYQVEVDWTGWRELAIPLSAFRDDNPGRGNDRFDPERDLTSGGLLELQLLFSPATDAHDEIRVDVDNLRWAP